MTGEVFVINTPWAFVAVVLMGFVAALFVLYIEGRD